MNRILRLTFLISICLSPAHAESEWNQWRGPERTGEVPAGSPIWPDTLSGDRLTKLWEISFGESYASPVVSGEIVYSVATQDKTFEAVKAIDLAGGKPIWEKSWEGSMKVPFFAAKNGSWARCTPAVADGAIYVGGIRDVLIKLDAATGQEVWRIDFMEREGTELPAFGHVSSPLPDDGAIYVQAGCAVTKLDAASGKTLWRAMENRQAMFGSAFASPVIGVLGGKRQVVALTRSALGGMDPSTGEVLWSAPVESFRGMNILTPILIGENKVFTASYGGGSFLFTVERTDDGKFSVTEKWRLKDLEGYMASPLVIGDHLYLLGRDKRLHCLAIETGEIAWSTEEIFGEYCSMIQQGDRVLALDQKGELILFRASPDAFRLLDRREISPSDPTWAHLGISGDKLLVRSLSGLSAYQWK